MASEVSKYEKNADDVVRMERSCCYKFFGRDVEIQKLYQVMTNSQKLVVQIFGLRQVGKSRLMLQLMKLLKQEKGYRCCYHKTRKGGESFLASLRNCLVMNDKTHTHGAEHLVTQFVECAKAKHIETYVFFLDDVNTDDDLKNFLKDAAVSCENVKFVLTTTDKMSVISPIIESLEVGPLDDTAMTQLVHEVVGTVVDSKEDEVFIRAIARLCEGMPVAALLMGTEMTEDYGLMTPSDILELLLQNRISALSPDAYPSSDRIGEVYMDSYSSLQDMFKDMFKRLSLKGNQFSPQDAVQAVNSVDLTESLVKKKYIQPLVRSSFVSLDGSNPCSREKMLTVHNFFKECIEIQRESEAGKSQEKRRLIHEKAQSIGLNAPIADLENPWKLAQLIAEMKCPLYEENSKNTSSENVDDDKTSLPDSIPDTQASADSFSGPRAMSNRSTADNLPDQNSLSACSQTQYNTSALNGITRDFNELNIVCDSFDSRFQSCELNEIIYVNGAMNDLNRSCCEVSWQDNNIEALNMLSENGHADCTDHEQRKVCNNTNLTAEEHYVYEGYQKCCKCAPKVEDESCTCTKQAGREINQNPTSKEFSYKEYQVCCKQAPDNEGKHCMCLIPSERETNLCSDMTSRHNCIREGACLEQSEETERKLLAIETRNSPRREPLEHEYMSNNIEAS